MKIAIAGAGIGGLSAGLCLHEQGFEVRIFEAVETLQPLGVGSMMPHASGALHGLGLGDELDEMAIRTRAIEYCTRFGHLSSPTRVRSKPDSSFHDIRFTAATCSFCCSTRYARGPGRLWSGLV